jgi:hypothetical protein
MVSVATTQMTMMMVTMTKRTIRTKYVEQGEDDEEVASF